MCCPRIVWGFHAKVVTAEDAQGLYRRNLLTQPDYRGAGIMASAGVSLVFTCTVGTAGRLAGKKQGERWHACFDSQGQFGSWSGRPGRRSPRLSGASVRSGSLHGTRWLLTALEAGRPAQAPAWPGLPWAHFLPCRSHLLTVSSRG